jgi:hypothetical protein
MSLTKQSAWTIFEGEKLGRAEATATMNRLTKPEFEAYQCHAEDFELAVAKIGAEAQNEAAKIWEDNPTTVAELSAIPTNRWTAEQYIQLVSLFKGTKYEQLHLSAQFRITNNALLLELAKASL